MSFFVPGGSFVYVGEELIPQKINYHNQVTISKSVVEDYSTKMDHSESEFELMGISYEPFYRVKVTQCDFSVKYYNLPEKNHYHTDVGIIPVKSLTEGMALQTNFFYRRSRQFARDCGSSCLEEIIPSEEAIFIKCIEIRSTSCYVNIMTDEFIGRVGPIELKDREKYDV